MKYGETTYVKPDNELQLLYRHFLSPVRRGSSRDFYTNSLYTPDTAQNLTNYSTESIAHHQKHWHTYLIGLHVCPLSTSAITWTTLRNLQGAK